MEIHIDHGLRLSSPGGSLLKKGLKSDFVTHQLKSHVHSNGKAHSSPSHHRDSLTNGGAKGNGTASFSTNSNSVVCLPLVSEGLKLVWTQSDQTKELDGIPELVQAFNVFPYPTSQEVSTLAHICSLPLDKVKVWFMVQRIKYGISWASEEIEETRCKLASPEHVVNAGQDKNKKRKKSGCDDPVDQEDKGHTEEPMHVSPHKLHKTQKIAESESVKISLSSSLTLDLSPQSSDTSKQPTDSPATTPPADLPTAVESPLGAQHKHGRYKKSKAQLTALRKSFLKENWPAETELRRLQDETGLSRNEIRKWFSDSRYQLRIGRSMPGLMSLASQEEMLEPHVEPEQLQPLCLVTEKQPNSEASNGEARKKKVQKSGSDNSQFFQVFLSNTLEAFGGGNVKEGKIKDTTEIRPEEDCDIQSKDTEVGSKQDGGMLTESSVSTPLILCISPKRISPKSSPKLLSKSSKKSVKSSTAVSSLSCPSQLLTSAGRVRKTKEQLSVLKEYFLRCPWPKSEEYTQLVELTSLPRADVIQWFGDTRYAVKNGQLRWVRGTIRDQILAEIALQQNGADVSACTGAPKNEQSRKRRSQSNSSKAPKSMSDSSDTHPLELYHRQTGCLQEKDLDSLCRKSKMSYQQVRDWFASKDAETLDLRDKGTDDY